MRTITMAPLVILAAALCATAQGTYTQIDYPGALGTLAFGINNAGDIVGLYASDNLNSHGFLLSGDIYTTIDYPGATYTVLYGVNDTGQIVGGAGPGYINTAFVYDRNSGEFTIVPPPQGANTFVALVSINNSGSIAGSAQLQGSPYYVGFVRVGGVYHSVAVSGYASTGLSGINNLGVAVGTAFDVSKPISNFRYASLSSGMYEILPFTVSGADPSVFGINDLGAITGSNFPANGRAEGFILQHGVSRRVSFPGARFCEIGAINNAGQVAGWYNRQRTSHGFLWTPPAPKGH